MAEYAVVLAVITVADRGCVHRPVRWYLGRNHQGNRNPLEATCRGGARLTGRREPGLTFQHSRAPRFRSMRRPWKLEPEISRHRRSPRLRRGLEAGRWRSTAQRSSSPPRSSSPSSRWSQRCSCRTSVARRRCGSCRSSSSRRRSCAAMRSRTSRFALLGVRRQSFLQLGLLLVPLVTLPIAVAADAGPGENPHLGLLWALVAAAGLPFLVVTTASPVLQRWFSACGDAASRDPYFLYSAGNAGSLLGLLAYPIVIEPLLTLPEQARLWTAGYAVFVVLAALCTLRLLATEAPASVPAEAREAAPPIGRLTTLRWIGMAALPSSLMIATTSHLSTDIAAVPLLWVIPLALYLLSFIVAFARSSPFSMKAISRATVISSLLAVASLMPIVQLPIWAVVSVHGANLFFVALLVHRRLAIERPPCGAPHAVLPPALRWEACAEACSPPCLPRRSSRRSPSTRSPSSWRCCCGRAPGVHAAADSCAGTPTSCCRSRSSQASSAPRRRCRRADRPAGCCSACSCSPPSRLSRSSRRVRFALPWAWGRCS